MSKIDCTTCVNNKALHFLCERNYPEECVYRRLEPRPDLPGLQTILHKIHELEQKKLDEIHQHIGTMLASVQLLYLTLHDRARVLELLTLAFESEYELTGDCKLFGEIAEALGVEEEE